MGMTIKIVDILVTVHDGHSLYRKAEGKPSVKDDYFIDLTNLFYM
jgi:hypothetical protein